MKKGITFIEVIVGIVIISTSVLVLLSMMIVYNKSYEETNKLNSTITELLRTKEVIDQFMENNRNLTFTHQEDKLYISDELVLEINDTSLIDYQSNRIISLANKKIEMKVLNNNLISFVVEVKDLKQEFMYFLGGYIIDS